MIIEIDGNSYILRVKETYMNEDKEFCDEIIALDEWVEIVRKKAISTLFQMEDVISGFVEKPVRLSEDYPEIKKPILNLSGSVSRLPHNLIVERIE
jgi:hypothetical protein